MSVKAIRKSAAMVFATALAWPVLATAFDLPSPVTDPLRTLPEVVDQGVFLPGDSAPIPCAVRKDFSRPLALGEAVDLALCNNPQIKSAWADIKIQAGAVGEGRAAYLPALSSSLGRTHDELRYPGSRYPPSAIDRNTVQGALTWRLFDFGGRSANRQAAEHLLAAAIAGHDATLQKALSSVIQSYFDALTARAALKAKAENHEIARDTLDSARSREARGAISQSDTLRATTALAKASLEQNRAQGEYQKALAVLRHILGVEGDTVISLPEEIRSDGGESGKALNDWLEEAQRNHPAIVAARNQLEVARNRVDVARSAGLPALGLSANFYQNTRPGEAVTANETTETTVGLVLNIPIFDGFSSTYKVRGAQAQVEQKKAQLADAEHQIVMEVIKAHADAASSLGNLDASAALLGAARSALAVSQRKYDKGAADITEVLSNQAALADAQQERIRCLDEWQSARLRLLASAGRLGRSAIVE